MKKNYILCITFIFLVVMSLTSVLGEPISTKHTINNEETITTTANTLPIEIKVISLDSSNVQFEINGEQTPQMKEGDSYTIIDQKFEGGLGKIELIVDSVVYQLFEGGIQQAKISLTSSEVITPTESTGPVELSEEVKVVCNGCELKTKCYPFGYRKDGKYCSDETNFVDYKGKKESCDNNFECKSNICVNSECISEGFLKKIMNWFGRIFGEE